MEIEERKKQARSFLGKTVTIKIDRPIGYSHKKETYSISYPMNYGYIPGEIGGDGEELDVYLLGVEEPVDEYVAKVIGIIHRQNDNEDKLVAAPEGMCFTRKQIKDAVDFQEKYYDIYVETESSILQLIFNNDKFENLPIEFIENFHYRTIIPLRENILNFYTDEEYEEICSKSHTVPALSWLYVQKSTMKLPEPDTIEDFVKWYLPTYLYIYEGEVRMNLSWEGRHLQLKVVMIDEWE